MYHRVYTLTHGVSQLGLRPQDFVVILFGFTIGLNVIGAFFEGYLRLVVAAAFLFLTFKVWQSLRDRMPDKYLIHLFRWLSEPEVFRASPDSRAIPLLIKPRALEETYAKTARVAKDVNKHAKEGESLAHLA